MTVVVKACMKQLTHNSQSIWPLDGWTNGYIHMYTFPLELTCSPHKEKQTNYCYALNKTNAHLWNPHHHHNKKKMVFVHQNNGELSNVVNFCIPRRHSWTANFSIQFFASPHTNIAQELSSVWPKPLSELAPTEMLHSILLWGNSRLPSVF